MFKPILLALTGSLIASASAYANDAKPDRILIAVTNNSVLGDSSTPTGLHLSELTHPYFAFKEAGFEVDFVSPNGGKSPVDPNSINDEDPANDRFWEQQSTRHLLETTTAANSVSAKDYAAILFVGGHGTMWDFPGDTALARLAAQIYENGGIVSAICHGPAGIIDIRLSNGTYLVAGKQVTSLTNLEEEIGGRMNLMPFLLETELIARGANFSKAEPWQSHVVVSERLITAQNPQSVSEMTEKLIGLIKTKQ